MPVLGARLVLLRRLVAMRLLRLLRPMLVLETAALRLGSLLA